MLWLMWQLSITAHMDLVESFRPDVLQPLCDTASSLENQTKRIKKSVNRTLRFLDWTLEMKAHSEVSKVTQGYFSYKQLVRCVSSVNCC